MTKASRLLDERAAGDRALAAIQTRPSKSEYCSLSYFTPHPYFGSREHRNLEPTKDEDEASLR